MDRGRRDDGVNCRFRTVEEALVNAVYRRSHGQREQVDVHLNPDGIEVISFPGS
jgi:hypothetical protein